MSVASRTWQAQLSAAACAASLAACVRTLPPAPQPEPTRPQVNTNPQEAGTGRLVVDVVDGPTEVRRIDYVPVAQTDAGGGTRYSFERRESTLCAASPCVVDMPAGNLILGFPVMGSRDLETELVHVSQEASLYRRALSDYNGETGGLYVPGIIATALGGVSLATGAALLPVGLSGDSDGLTIAGAASLGGGALLLTLGILAIRKDAPTYRPGSSLHIPF